MTTPEDRAAAALLDALDPFMKARISDARAADHAAGNGGALGPIGAALSAVLAASDVALFHARRAVRRGDADAGELLQLLLKMAECWDHHPAYPIDQVVAYAEART